MVIKIALLVYVMVNIPRKKKCVRVMGYVFPQITAHAIMVMVQIRVPMCSVMELSLVIVVFVQDMVTVRKLILVLVSVVTQKRTALKYHVMERFTAALKFVQVMENVQVPISVHATVVIVNQTAPRLQKVTTNWLKELSFH